MSEPRTPLPHKLCARLCSKKLHMINDDREICLEDFHTAGYENFWCTHTQTDTGPDDGWVTLDRCAPGRDCYEPVERSTGLGYRYRVDRTAEQ
jgi:hypothetical protein